MNLFDESVIETYLCSDNLPRARVLRGLKISIGFVGPLSCQGQQDEEGRYLPVSERENLRVQNLERFDTHTATVGLHRLDQTEKCGHSPWISRPCVGGLDRLGNMDTNSSQQERQNLSPKDRTLRSFFLFKGLTASPTMGGTAYSHARQCFEGRSPYLMHLGAWRNAQFRRDLAAGVNRQVIRRIDFGNRFTDSLTYIRLESP